MHTFLHARRVFLLAAACLFSSCQVRTSTPEESAGSSALPSKAAPPVVRATVLNEAAGDVFDLSRHRGRVQVLAVLQSSGMPSRALVESLNRLSSRWANSPASLVGLAVDRGDQAEIEGRVRGLNAAFPIAWLDDASLQSLGTVRALPSVVLVDKRGMPRKVLPGVSEDSVLLAEVDALLAEP